MVLCRENVLADLPSAPVSARKGHDVRKWPSRAGCLPVFGLLPHHGHPYIHHSVFGMAFLPQKVISKLGQRGRLSAEKEGIHERQQTSINMRSIDDMGWKALTRFAGIEVKPLSDDLDEATKADGQTRALDRKTSPNPPGCIRRRGCASMKVMST